jgi:hypothetical protein
MIISKYGKEPVLKNKNPFFLHILPIINTASGKKVVVREELINDFNLNLPVTYVRALSIQMPESWTFAEAIPKVLDAAGLIPVNPLVEVYQKMFPVAGVDSPTFHVVMCLLAKSPDDVQFKETNEYQFNFPGTVKKMSAEEFKDKIIEGTHDLPTELLSVFALSLLEEN